ncbi:MAG: hypothetical protein JKY43_07905 [Phycisphaerales bacterium]|nr:hypothetical protein [Phycisphaerales bacterium]
MIITRKKIDPCLHEYGCEDCWSQLEEGVQYRVIEINSGSYSIQVPSEFDDWKPSLYPAGLFDILDASVEPDWIVDIHCYPETDDDGDEIYDTNIGFPEFMERGFWEDVHDNKPESHQILIPIFERLGLVHP